MWAQLFSSRLCDWNILRSEARDKDVESALLLINDWWFQAPWKVYKLHWFDQANWPDPWQLLEDIGYCDLARGLGILYTITLIDHSEIQDSSMILTHEDHNLVLATKRKYILNWKAGDVLNSNNILISIKRIITQQELKQTLLK